MYKCIWWHRKDDGWHGISSYTVLQQYISSITDRLGVVCVFLSLLWDLLLLIHCLPSIDWLFGAHGTASSQMEDRRGSQAATRDTLAATAIDVKKWWKNKTTRYDMSCSLWCWLAPYHTTPSHVTKAMVWYRFMEKSYHLAPFKRKSLFIFSTIWPFR